MTATVYEIPIQPSTAQTFTVTLSGITYTFTLRWNEVSNCWILDIGDQANNPIVTGITLVTGSDLLEQYDYLEFGGALVVQSDNAADEVPDFDTLGVTGHLYYVTP